MDFLNFILFSVSLTIVSCNKYVPVLLWSNRPKDNSGTDVSVFSKINSNEFSDLLVKMIRVDKPTILVFTEENLSVEDFSWKNTDGNEAFPFLKNLTKSSESITYLPSVENPLDGISKLETLGYSRKKFNNSFKDSVKNNNIIYEVEMKKPPFLLDRADMFKEHDQDIVKIYKETLKHHANILAIYSGYHNYWLENKSVRSKRQTPDGNITSDLIIADEKNVVRIMTTTPILYKVIEPNKDPVVINIVKFVGEPTTDIEKDKISMTVRFVFNDQPVAVKFEFSSTENDWWMLDGVEILDYKLKMIPSISIGAPAQYSYFCNPVVEFKNNTASLIFENLQVQPRVGKGKDFGPVLHCIPYFSIAIWSGLIVVFILSIVLGWGIVMIMDINTNDRFDDPKGKTITISAAD